jgi:hypothetical protein
MVAAVAIAMPARAQTDAAVREVLFASNWSAGDPMDGGKWTRRIGNGRLNHVVAVGDSLDFPTSNVLAVVAGWRAMPPGALAENQRMEGLPDLATGASRYYRWYIRVVVPEAYQADVQTHPIQDATTGGMTNWMFEVIADQPHTWALSWNVRGAWPNNRWICRRRLQRGVTYRVELGLTRLSESTMTIEARVYQGDALVCDAADFRNVRGTADFTSRPVLAIHDPAEFRALQVGFNGLRGGGEADYPITLYYQGAVAVCDRTWCGAIQP